LAMKPIPCVLCWEKPNILFVKPNTLLWTL